MNHSRFFGYPLFALFCLTLLAACVGPQGKSHDGGTTYVLRSTLPQQSGYVSSAPTLLISPMRAHPGFDTPRRGFYPAIVSIVRDLIRFATISHPWRIESGMRAHR